MRGTLFQSSGSGPSPRQGREMCEINPMYERIPSFDSCRRIAAREIRRHNDDQSGQNRVHDASLAVKETIDVPGGL